MDQFFKRLNIILDNDFVRMFTIVLTGILAGYILQPVPEWLNNLFNTSHSFKFVVLIFIGLGISSPITLNKLITIIITATVISVLFAFMRQYDRKDELISQTNSDVPVANISVAPTKLAKISADSPLANDINVTRSNQ